MGLIGDMQRNLTAAMTKLEGHHKLIEHTAEQLVVYQDETRLQIDRAEENRRLLDQKVEKQLQKLFKAIDVTEIMKPFGPVGQAGKADQS